MTNFASSGLLLLALLCGGAAALPGGCGGTLGMIDIQSPNFNSPVWTCADINPRSLFAPLGGGVVSGGSLLASFQTSNDQSCGNGCAAWWGTGATLFAAFRYNGNQTCQCWEIWDITTWNITPATGPDDNATFIDFYDVGVNAPTAAQDWGIITCPEGSWTQVVQGVVGVCHWLTVIPAGPPLNPGFLGPVSAAYCSSVYNAQYAIADAENNFNCYGDLAGVEYYFNYSSPYALYDMYDFTNTPPSSTSTKLSTKSSGVTVTSSRASSTSSGTSSTSTSKPTVKSTSTPKPTVKSTSTAVSTLKSSLKSSIKTTSTPKSSSSSTHKSTGTSTSKA